MISIDLKHSLGIRMFIVAFLTLALLIPSVLIQELISERESRRDSAAEEISRSWGSKQIISGPLITVPYLQDYERDGNLEQVIRYAHFLPENLTVEGSVAPEIRYRGIHNVIIYSSKLTIAGNFQPINLNGLNVPLEDFLLEDAYLAVGIFDMTGITEAVTLNWNGEEYTADPGIESADVLTSGISISPELETGTEYHFDFDLNLNGSSGLFFTPVGKETRVSLSSDWPDPGFTGNFLPVQREVHASGFTATWTVLHLNRNFPQQWTGSNQEVSNTTFGVDLLLPVDEYQKTMRTTKYAIMFISLTFLSFFMIELLTPKAVHPVQYLLIGFGLLIFYTLLLSISEYIVFSLAYFIASVAIILLITFYTYSTFSDKYITGMIFGVLSLLYGYLYILLQLQDYALLFGSIGLFAILATVMYLTRNIDWFKILGGGDQEKVDQKSAG